MLFVKVISTPYPPRKEPPENVMRGPGLLLQSYAEKSAEMATGIGRLVLLMWGNDDDDAANDGDVMGALDDPSVHAPTRKSAPSRAAALRSVPVHMVASLSLRWWPTTTTWRAPPAGTARQDPRVSGQEVYLERWEPECRVCTHAGSRAAEKRCGARTTRPWQIGNHGFSRHFGSVTAGPCEASLLICPSRSQAERRGERAQCGCAGAGERAGRRPARQHFEGAPGRIRPGDRGHGAAAATAQGGRGVDQRTALAAARADGVLRILGGGGCAVGPSPDERPHGGAKRQDLQKRPRDAEQPAVHFENGFVGRELHHAVPRAAAQGAVHPGPHSGPILHVRHARSPSNGPLANSRACAHPVVARPIRCRLPGRRDCDIRHTEGSSVDGRACRATRVPRAQPGG